MMASDGEKRKFVKTALAAAKITTVIGEAGGVS